MKKIIILIILMCIVACCIFLGFQFEKTKGKEITNNNTVSEVKTDTNTNTTNKTTKTSNSSSTTNTTNITKDASNSKSTTNEELKPTEIKKQYDNDLPLGVEVRNVSVNGKDVVVNIQTSGSSKQQKNGPYYIYYEVRVGHDKFKLVKEGIHHLEGYGIEMLKTFDMEEDVGTNYEFFEWDFTASVYKGTDKEYLAISIPAGTEDKNQTSLILTTDEGKLVGEFTANTVDDITLTGKNVENYKNHKGNAIFTSIKNGKITYLVPTEKMYKTDSKGNKVLDNSLDTLELDEYSVTINKDKATAKKTGEIYKITNAKGKTFGFGKFKH